MKEIKELSWIKINGLDIMIISDSYKGYPIIAYKPDYLIISKKTYAKFKDQFKIKIDPKRIFFI